MSEGAGRRQDRTSDGDGAGVRVSKGDVGAMLQELLREQVGGSRGLSQHLLYGGVDCMRTSYLATHSIVPHLVTLPVVIAYAS